MKIHIAQSIIYLLAAVCFVVAAVNQDCSGIPEACICLSIATFMECFKKTR